LVTLVLSFYDDEVLALFEGIPSFKVALTDVQQGINVVDLLAAHTSIFPSKGEAKKMIQGGGTAMNKVKINSVDEVFNAELLISGKYFVAQKGRRNYFLIIAE